MNVSATSTMPVYSSASSSSSKSSTLSSEQQALLKDVLSQYDSNSLSASDASEIVKAFEEAGIEPSQALTSAMKTEGYDAKEIGNLASASQAGGSKPMGGPPPRPPKEETDSVSSLLESLLSSSEDEEEDDTTTALSSSTVSSSSFDTVLDYTTKIMSLKDNAKTDVMNMLEQYNSDANKLSQEDTQKLIVNSLKQILNDSDNFNTISFYA